MSKQQFEPSLHTTYQTGVTEQPSQKSNPLVAALLVLTIFLGGLASALGLLNIRLLQQLQQAGGTVPVDIYTQSSAATLSPEELNNDLPEPTLPQQRDVSLELYLPPSRSESKQHALSRGEIYAVNEQSIVTLHCSTDHITSTGMGVVMHQDGYILTNAHLVQDCSRIYVQLSSGAVYRAALVGTDALTDLAVLYIQAEDLKPAVFSNSQMLVEEDGVAVAQPEQGELADGRVTHARRRVTLGAYKLQLLQTDVDSCDGPVFNAFGQIVGMNSSVVPTYFNLYLQPGTGYAIPSTTIQEVADQLMQQGFVAGRPTLGLETVSVSKVYQQYWNLPGGLRILEVSPLAAEQDIQKDDILLALNGQRVNEAADLQRILYAHSIGDSLTAVIFRDGHSITISLTILDTAA